MSRRLAKEHRPADSLDAYVVAAIEHLFPDGTHPDQENFTGAGLQYKAPDHSILDGWVLIERKTLNRVDDGQFYSKLVEIARLQGVPMQAFGLVNAAQIIGQLPDRESANRMMTDYMHNQLGKTIGEARKQFENHAVHRGETSCARMLVVSDHSEMEGATDSVEYFIGRKFIRNRDGDIQTGLIDCIVYLKAPVFVWDRPNSYWFKCLIDENAAERKKRILRLVSDTIFVWLKENFPSEWKREFKAGQYRPLEA